MNDLFGYLYLLFIISLWVIAALVSMLIVGFILGIFKIEFT
jgi:hypothetical protein